MTMFIYYYQIILILYLSFIPELEWLFYYIVYIIVITTFCFLYLNYNARFLGINKVISSKFAIIEPNSYLPFIKSYRLTKFNFYTIYFS
jgi:hypothetical protein